MERRSLLENSNVLNETSLSRNFPQVKHHYRSRIPNSSGRSLWVVFIGNKTPHESNSEFVQEGEILEEYDDGYYIHDHRGKTTIDGMPASWIPRVRK